LRIAIEQDRGHGPDRTMYKAINGTDAAPLHPGEILRVDILPCLSMTAGQLAAYIGLPRSELDRLLAERVSMTPALAQRLGLALGHGAHYWLAVQMQYDLWQAAQLQSDDIQPIAWKRRVLPNRTTASGAEYNP
jgi:addiction module HigA family antidote